MMKKIAGLALVLLLLFGLTAGCFREQAAPAMETVDTIDKIKVTVEGSPLSIEHVYLQDPVGREDLPSP